jgi:site-specific DNA recombinase
MTRQNHSSNGQLAIAYLRVSTDEQQLGPEAQRAAIELWATTAGVTVTAWHLDQGVSGGAEIDDRPALVAALADLRASGAGVFVVAKRDRLARDVYVAATIERAVGRCRARVICADGTGNGDSPADQFMRTVIDGAAEYERALIRARTKAALGVKRARMESTGTPPYGFRLADDGIALVPAETEQQTLATARSLRAAGLSYRRIRSALTERAMYGRTGRPFTLQATFTMVQRAAMHA